MRDKTYVIAEVGINHEGDVDQCARMIEAATASGADAVKLQTIDADANYVAGTSSYQIFKGSELTRDETARMFELASDLGIDIFTTCGDLPTAQWVDELNPSAWKISSGLLTHTSMIRSLAGFGRPMLISSGMATVEEIEQAIASVRSVGNERISLFQCTSLYPAPVESLNLAAIRTMQQRFGYEVGFSDHSIGTDAAFLAVAAGATMIEKHFSFDVNRVGFDHAISLDGEGFKEMVDRVRMAETMMGSADKELSEAIQINRSTYLRTVVALKNIVEGECFSYDNLGVKRPLPGKRGSDPKYLEKMIGQVAGRDFSANEPVLYEGDEQCL